MSHSEERDPDSEEQAAEESAEAAPEKAEQEDAQEGTPEQEDPEENQAEPADHRMAALMKMRSQYVTEETLRSTEEHSKPKPEPKPEDDEEFLDDEEYYEDGEYDDEHYDEEFEDDDYEDEELRPREAARSKPKSEPDDHPDPGAASAQAEEEEDDEELDHRVAQLRKLRKTFVTEKDLEIKAGPTNQADIFKDVEIKKVVCPNCQSEELRTQKICAQCGAKLPKLLVEEEKYNPGTLNKAVLKYYDAVRQLRSEAWTIEQFLDFLHDRYDLSKAQIDGLHELIEECGSQEWLPDATKLIFESTDTLETAILVMIDKINEAVNGHVDFDPDDYPLEDADGNLIEYPFEDEDGNMIEFPLTLEEKILEIDFQPELEDIKRANGMMLNTLKLIDAFQKQAQEDLEVSM